MIHAFKKQGHYVPLTCHSIGGGTDHNKGENKMAIVYALKLGVKYVTDVSTGDLGGLLNAQTFGAYKDAKLNIDTARKEKIVKIEIRDLGPVNVGRPWR